MKGKICKLCIWQGTNHWCSELWCWRRQVRVPWTARRSNQSILKGISPEYSLGGLMLKMKLQYFGHLMQRIDPLEKTLKLGKTEGRRRRGNRRRDSKMVSPTQWTRVWANSKSWWWTGKPAVLWSMGSQRVWHDWKTELNWIYHQGFSIYYLTYLTKTSLFLYLHCHFLSSYSHLNF